MSACNCCDLFPLEFDLEHRGEVFSASKCGYTNKSLDNEACYDGNGVFSTLTTTWEPDGNDPAGRTTYVITETQTWDAESKTCVYTRDPETDEPPYDDLAGGSFTYELSAEYTSEELMENVYAALPPIEGEWEEATVLSPAEIKRELIDKVGEDCYPKSLYTESSLEVRIAHPPTATCYLKVWLVARTREYDQQTETYGPPTDAAFQIYEWEGAPADMTIGINEQANRVEGETYVVPRPDEAQTKVTIEVFKFSFLPEYEPDDPQVDSENDYAFIRPTPDCLSNGVPTLNAECPPAP